MNYEFPPIGGGGGRASAELIRALIDRGHELRLITSRAEKLPPREQHDGFQIIRVATGRRSLYRASFNSMARYVLSGLRPGLSQVREWRPEVIHAHFAVPTGALAYALRRLTGVPYVLTAHLGDVPGGVPEKTTRWFRIVGPMTPAIWRRAAFVAAVSEYTRELAARRYAVPVVVIPNGLTLPPESDPEPDRPPRLIFAGRFQPQKNLPFLVEALAKVSDLDWSCSLVGDGPEMSVVADRIKAHGLETRVELPGWLSPDGVEALLHESDLLVMPSLSEGLPVVGVQALAYGVAIAASRAGGLTELVDDGSNGCLSDIGDLNQFADSLRWSLTDRDRLREMKRASRVKAADFDIDRVAREYESLFKAASHPASDARVDQTQ
ncbi:MAG: glycosyltransferase family 4 protein [Anaerolineales bacterium]